jgi:hypothetical protein
MKAIRTCDHPGLGNIGARDLFIRKGGVSSQARRIGSARPDVRPP